MRPPPVIALRAALALVALVHFTLLVAAQGAEEGMEGSGARQSNEPRADAVPLPPRQPLHPPPPWPKPASRSTA